MNDEPRMFLPPLNTHTSYFILHTSLKCEIIPRISFELVILFSSQLQRCCAGGHRGVVIPVPIPNTEVKGSIAEGSAGLARARVGRRRLFLPFPKGKKRFT